MLTMGGISAIIGPIPRREARGRKDVPTTFIEVLQMYNLSHLHSDLSSTIMRVPVCQCRSHAAPSLSIARSLLELSKEIETSHAQVRSC